MKNLIHFNTNKLNVVKELSSVSKVDIQFLRNQSAVLLNREDQYVIQKSGLVTGNNMEGYKNRIFTLA